MTAQLELGPGYAVGERYVVQRVLGRGGFAITYLAHDKVADRMVALKELAPQGSTRLNSHLELPDAASASRHRLVHQFLREAKLLARLRLPGVVQIYDAFQFGGTVYSVMEYLADAISLDRVLAAQGSLPYPRALRILLQVAASLEEIHRAGYLHRDIKPSNILLLPGDEAVLIDFGAAREWQADSTVEHTALYTPGYAPIEQLGERGRRGPQTDVYALAATAFEMLTGALPTSAVDRVNGIPLRPISDFVDDVPQSAATAIAAGLALKASDRPPSASAFARMLEEPVEAGQEELSEVEAMDDALCRLSALRVPKNACPCGGLLETPKPLKSNACPVCRNGILRRRTLEENRCPVCRSGVIVRERNHDPMRYCPLCKHGILVRAKGFSRKQLRCGNCEARFEIPKTGFLRFLGAPKEQLLVDEGFAGPEIEFWLPMSERSDLTARCAGCGAQWDIRPSGAMTLTKVSEDPYGIAKQHSNLTAAEWARVAARLPVDAGNVYCEVCGADYYRDEGSITLIDAPTDAFGFAAEYLGRRLDPDRVPWMGVGKASGAEGPVCSSCGTEFDAEGGYLRLRHSEIDSLRAHVDEAWPIEDWHRLAHGLPTRDTEAEFVARFHELLREAAIRGEIEWAGENRWESTAVRLVGEAEHRGKLTVGPMLIAFANRKAGFSGPIDAVLEARADGEILRLKMKGEAEEILLKVESQEISMRMRSGKVTLDLTAEDCARALVGW